jgi:hypothetical protein
MDRNPDAELVMVAQFLMEQEFRFARGTAGVGWN